MLRGLIIFGAGMYAGVYVAQNYQGALVYFCEKTSKACDEALDDYKKRWLVILIFIEKVEDPKVLMNKVYDMIKEKIDEVKNPKDK